MEISKYRIPVNNKKRNPQSVYTANDVVLKQTCSIIDTYREISNEFHKEFVSSCNKFTKKIYDKNQSVNTDTDLVSSHVILNSRSVARRYKLLSSASQKS